MTYQPKTTAEQRVLLDQWKVWARNNVSDAVATVLDDLASAKARIAELEAMVLELVVEGPPEDYRCGWKAACRKALALLNKERKDGAK